MAPTKRSIALCIVLSIVTCGIYGIYWIYTIIDFMYRSPNTPNRWTTSPLVTILLIIVTCGIYGIYAEYKWGKQMPEIFATYGQPCEDRSTMYVLLGVFQLSIITYCLIQNDINNLADITMGGGGYPQQQPPVQPGYYPPQQPPMAGYPQPPQQPQQPPPPPQG